MLIVGPAVGDIDLFLNCFDCLINAEVYTEDEGDDEDDVLAVVWVEIHGKCEVFLKNDSYKT